VLTLVPTSQFVDKGHDASFTATLTKDGSPVNGATVILIRQGVGTVDTQVTAGAGQCVLTCTVNDAQGTTGIQFRVGYEVP